MKKSEFIWNEFIYGGHWLSLGASAITLAVILILGVPFHLDLLILTYLLSYCIYKFNHYKEYSTDAEMKSLTAMHIKHYISYLPKIIFLNILLFILVLFYFGNIKIWIFGLFMLFSGLFYTLVGKKLAKKIIALKSIYIAACWASIVLFITFYYSLSFDWRIFLLFMFVFLRFLVDTIYYDIKDIKSDSKHQIWTFAGYLGKEKCLDFLQILNLFSFTPLFVGVLLGVLPTFSLFLFFIFFYNFYYIVKARDTTIDIRSLTYILVDGEYIYWPFLLLIGIVILPS